MAFFSKNKINKTINEASSNETTAAVDSEFESLISIKKKQKEKKLSSKIKNSYKEGIENFANKKIQTKQYLKQNYKKVWLYIFLLLFFATYVFAIYITFSPYELKFSGENLIDLNNFYVSQNAHIAGLTILGYVFASLLLLTIILSIVIFVWYKNKMIIKTNKWTKIFSVIAYIFAIASLILLIVFIVMPPKIYSSVSVQNIYNMVKQIENTTNDADKLPLIVNLNNLIKWSNLPIDPISSGTPTLQDFETWSQNSGYLLPDNYKDSALFYDSSYNLQPLGIAMIVVFTFLGSVGLIFIPFAIYFYLSVKQIQFDLINNQIQDNYNLFKTFLLLFMKRIGNFSLRNLKKVKNKETYHKYKKRLDETGMKAKNEEAFSTSASKDQLVLNQSSIYLDEMAKNPANVAYLSTNGKWMYHDGKNNLFVARGDEWIPFDLSKEIHKAHANIIDDNLKLSPSDKKAKENKSIFGKQKESDIALPDDEIDSIVKSLDI